MRLGMSDDALDRRKLAPQRALDVVDPLMHILDGEHRVDAAVEIDNLTLGGFAHAHVMNLPDKGDVRGNFRKRLAHGGDPFIRGIAPRQAPYLQRLNMS